MKSMLFANSELYKVGSARLDPIKADLSALLSISSEQWPVFITAVREILSTNVSKHGRVAEKMLPQLGISRSTFDNASKVAGWLATEFSPGERAGADTPEAVVDDMLELKLISENEKTKCLICISALKELVQDETDVEIKKEQNFQRSAPKVMGVETALFFRNVFGKKNSADD